MSDSANWPTCLLSPNLQLPAGLKTWNGSNPATRFAVYRNNVMASLIEALADTFPVIKALVGDEFFAAMAAVYIRQHPPCSPVLAYYGDQFSDFLRGFTPAESLPYLADMAQLEYARVLAFHAADASAIAIADLQHYLADPERLPELQLVLHPALHGLQSAYAVASLWFAHQGEAELSPIQWQTPESVWVLRVAQSLEVIPMAAGDCDFIQALQAGQTLGAAAAHAQAFDLTRCLNVLIQKQAIVNAYFTEEPL